ncbi:MAG: molybdopterin biosynthesis protein [Desulfobacterales bacterium]|nr:molybdopterin biosynthesis protein [Desulfobacterales bacterium]
MRQRQFLDVVDESVAHQRFDAACAHLQPRREVVDLESGLGRILAADVVSGVDVTAFDRSNMDGYAVRAEDTFGAEELDPIILEVAAVSLAAGQAPPEGFEVAPGEAVPVATGGVVPRGADAVLMVENTEPDAGGIRVVRSAVPGGNITFAGSDIGRGETVMRRGTRLSSRETGVLAAVGAARIDVIVRPRVAVVSTGDEIVEPGRSLEVGQVFDSNQRMLLDAVAELGCEPVPCGIVPDNEALLEQTIEGLLSGREAADVVLLSGGTSKGEGDLNATVVERLGERLPDSAGIIVHGVALKPGKPVLLAVVGGVPVVVLPGFPTSATFTFHEFVAPLLRRLSGRSAPDRGVAEATVPLRITSAPGRTEYNLVDLVEGPAGLAAYPLGAGSGSVTAFGRADGFIRIPAAIEYVEEGAVVDVHLLHPGVRPADLAAIGSHCVGFDHLLSLLADQGFRVKMVPVGSTGGLAAAGRGEADVAGIHLMDEETGEYNAPFLPAGVRLLSGYRRRQGIVFRSNDQELAECDDNALAVMLGAGARRMVNRNAGSGTRVLIDQLLEGNRPDGYLHQARTHHAVAAAVEQGRADWGVTLDTVAEAAGLEFRFLQDERYDFAIPESRWNRPAVVALRELLEDASVGQELRSLGFER